MGVPPRHLHIKNELPVQYLNGGPLLVANTFRNTSTYILNYFFFLEKKKMMSTELDMFEAGH